jgi:ribose/xylose/arabinose/galactoside ABC-type transport system permease subunit
MLRWLLVTLLALIIFSGLQPWLQKLGFGKLPGDFRFRLFGRDWFIPLASTLLLSLLAALIAWWL